MVSYFIRSIPLHEPITHLCHRPLSLSDPLLMLLGPDFLHWAAPLLLVIDALLPPLCPELWLLTPPITESCLPLSQLMDLGLNYSGREENRKKGKAPSVVSGSPSFSFFPYVLTYPDPSHPCQFSHPSFQALRAGLNLRPWHKLL